jgi:hypothetical protein
LIANLGVFHPTDAAGDEHVDKLDRHRDLEDVATGVEKVLGLAFRGHHLCALETRRVAGLPAPGTGAIVRVRRQGPPETIVSGLTFPTGMTVGPDGAIYVSEQGFGFPAGGRTRAARGALILATTPGRHASGRPCPCAGTSRRQEPPAAAVGAAARREVAGRKPRARRAPVTW